MKKLLKFIVVAVVLSAVAFSFYTCKKDTECDVLIKVREESDTNKVVPNAKVVIAKEDVRVEGLSDANGNFQYTFKLEAILDVVALAVKNNDTLYGETIVRLKPGETVYKTVLVK